MPVEFRALASSSAGCCYVIDDGRTPLLLEAGLPWRRIRERTGFRTAELGAVLISHSHLDHAVAIEDAMAAGIDVVATRETFEALGAGGHRAIICEPRRMFRLGTWSIMPFSVPHDAPGAVGFLLASGTEKWVYATDCGYIPHRFPGLTGLAVECNHSVEILRQRLAEGEIDPVRFGRVLRNHLALERLLEFLAANDLGQVREIHLIHVSDTNGDETAFKAAVMRVSGKPVYVAGA